MQQETTGREGPLRGRRNGHVEAEVEGRGVGERDRWIEGLGRDGGKGTQGGGRDGRG